MSRFSGKTFVLVGGAGFIGHNLALELAREGALGDPFDGATPMADPDARADTERRAAAVADRDPLSVLRVLRLPRAQSARRAESSRRPAVAGRDRLTVLPVTTPRGAVVGLHLAIGTGGFEEFGVFRADAVDPV